MALTMVLLGGLLDGAERFMCVASPCGAAEAVAVQAGPRPCRLQTKSRKLSNLGQVPQLGRVQVVLGLMFSRPQIFPA